MKYLNYIYGSGVEVFIDSLRKIPIAHASDIAEYASIQTGQIKTFPRYVKPTQYSLSGKITTDELTKRRKLEYLNSINSDVLLVLGSEHDAIYGNITDFKTERLKAGAIAFSATIKASGRAISDLAYEAEDVQGTGEVDVSDSDASSGTATQLATQYDDVYTEVTQSDFALPEGDYKIFVRAKDTAQVADDLNIEMYNISDSTSVGSTTKTLTADYALYESGTITVSADDVGDTIHIVAEKATSTTNTISIDFIGFARV